MVRVGAKYAVAIAGEEEAPHCGAFFVARVKREALPPLAGGRCPESLPPRRRGADGGMSSAVTAGACRTRSLFAAAFAPAPARPHPALRPPPSRQRERGRAPPPPWRKAFREDGTT